MTYFIGNSLYLAAQTMLSILNHFAISRDYVELLEYLECWCCMFELFHTVPMNERECECATQKRERERENGMGK